MEIITIYTVSYSASKYMVIRLIIKIIIPLNTVFLSIISKQIIDELTRAIANGNSYRDKLFMIIIVLMSIRIINTTLTGIMEYVTEMHNTILEQYMNEKILDKAMQTDLSLFDNPKYYNKLNLAKSSTSSITTILWNSIDFISSAISFIVIFVYSSSVNIYYTLLMLLACIPSAFVRRKFTNTLYKLNVKQMKDERQLGYLFHVSTVKEYAQDIRFYQLSDFFKSRFNLLFSKIVKEKKKTIIKNDFLSTFMNIIPEIVMGLALLQLISRIMEGNGTIGDYTLYTGLLTQIWSCIVMIISSVMSIYGSKLKIDNLEAFQKMKNKVNDTGTKILSELKSIRFENVDFSYPETECKIIKNLSLQINNGDKIVIVGLNGAGKSTLIKLLLRFYDVTAGNIFINDVNIREYKISSLRKCFSSYLQNSLNYSFTIRDNVQLANLDSVINEIELIHLFQLCNSEEILKRAPDGVDTYLTKLFEDNGLELSGGQNQKLALIRAFYRNGQVILLDEPSSSLDPKAENQLFQMLFELWKGKTVLYTTHRMSNISFADKIIVLEQGSVLEEGTMQELLNNNNRFSELYNYYMKQNPIVSTKL